ncbi:E3 ubiquitin-protein ligase DTX3L-like [Styela clava]
MLIRQRFIDIVRKSSGFIYPDAESQSSSQTASGPRIIKQQPSGGRMKSSMSQESLPGYEGWTIVITYSFPAGSLMGVSYEAQEFTEYLPRNDGRICCGLLYRAFNAGWIFKIQEVGDRRGKIVWNDEFPHKTNKTGGPENDGYPDPNHTMKLKEALKAKGFEFDASISNLMLKQLRF